VTTVTVVPNTSPLIALGRIGRLDLMADLYGSVLIPPAVATELSPAYARPPWIIAKPLAKPINRGLFQTTLGAGEREAISLASELNADWVVLDDLSARQVAKRRSIPVVGTVGIVLAAKHRGLIRAAQRIIDALIDDGFRVSVSIRAGILAAAGEAS
jgi:predicted nucleic acid-binding protein